MSSVTADVLAGGKMGTNPNGSKNETGAPVFVVRASSEIEPSCSSDVYNPPLGHVETSKYGSTSILEYSVESSVPDMEKTDHVPSKLTAGCLA